MKRFIALSLLILTLVGCSRQEASLLPEAADDTVYTTTEETVEETVEETAQEAVAFGDFSALTLDGETLTQEFFANADMTVVNFWATYCGPCKSHMPIMGSLDKELENVQFLGVALDCNDQELNADEAQVELAREIMAELGAEYPSVTLSWDLVNHGWASVSSVPATVFVDRDGNLIGQGFYGALDETQWREVIAQRLEELAQ